MTHKPQLLLRGYENHFPPFPPKNLKGKKMKLPFLSRNAETKPSWPWGSCGQLRTLSFRNGYEDIFRTMNSAYLETAAADLEETPARSLLSNSSETASFPTSSEDIAADQIETVIRGLRSDRLFFDPGETSSIMEEVKGKMSFPFKESIALSMESKDPQMDFRKSMEEMVEAHGLKEWKGLEELLFWFLMANGKSNHDYIVGAFVDLLVGLAFSGSDLGCSYDSPSSLLSFCNSSCDSSSCSSSSFTATATTPGVSSVEIEEIDNGPCLSSLLEDGDE